MSAPVLLLSPLSEQRGRRADIVADALRRKGVRVHTLAQALGRGRGWSLITPSALSVALRASSRVVVVPRPDGSIGAGTLRDVRAAETSDLPIYVVSPSGKMLPLAAAGLVELDGDVVNAARFTTLGAER